MSKPFEKKTFWSSGPSTTKMTHFGSTRVRRPRMSGETKEIKTVRKVKPDNEVISMTDFMNLYENKSETLHERGGTAIFNKDLTSILLIKGAVSKKWGFPKGIRDQQENNLETALRETREEIGWDIKLATPILPNVLVDDANIYGVVMNEKIDLKTQEKEIDKYGWLSLTDLMFAIKSQRNSFTKMIRNFMISNKYKILIDKIKTFGENNKLEHGLYNGLLKTQLDMVDQRNRNKNINLYSKYYLIKTTYPKVFSDLDIVIFLRSL